MKIYKIYVDEGNHIPSIETEEDFLRRAEGYWKEGTALRVLEESGMLRTPFVFYFSCFPIPFNEGWVSMDSLRVEGVDSQDYPDFTDSFLSQGEWVNGVELTEDELSELDTLHPDLAYELAMENFI